MPHRIQSLSLALPLRLGIVHCYLIQTDAGFVLIDTGGANNRADLERALAEAGCRSGDLKLIVLTHGDFDHCGNAAYLRRKHGSKIAMHYNDSGMVELGDMFVNREKANALLRFLGPILFGFGKAERFRADVYLEDGMELSQFGFEARVIHMPGHSKGSIGILTSDGKLFCGDMFESTERPRLNAIMDDIAAARASVKKLEGKAIHTVYPGHGEPFPMESFRGSGQMQSG